MSSFSICRIIGNELPPRDSPGTKLKCLKYILDTENLKNAHKVWIINQIINDDYKSKIYEVLKNEKEVYEIAFDYKLYKNKKTWNEKVKYAVNINSARNFGIKLCQKKFDYVACLDQDCYFWPEQWNEIIQNIKNDSSPKNHYGLISKRFHFNFIPKSINDLIDEEPMIIFNKNANLLFDESIKFGDNEKNELLWRLKIKNYDFIDKKKCVGYVMHVGFGNEIIETNVHERVKARKKGLENLLNEIEKKYLKKRKFL